MYQKALQAERDLCVSPRSLPTGAVLEDDLELQSFSAGTYRFQRNIPFVRVPDTVLKSVGFLCEVTYTDGAGVVDADPIGTGFFVTVRSPGGRYWFFFVTAAHVAESLKGKSAYVLVNKKEGGAKSVNEIDGAWWLHPTDKSCDVAIVLCRIASDLDVVCIPQTLFATDKNIQELGIGVGDEVFMAGLFTLAPGEGENLPIVRHGNIAMMPNQQIQTDRGFADVYLVEARSTGGMSGSPVFVRETIHLPLDADKPDLVMRGLGRMYFLGLMLGHWDIKESELNDYAINHDRTHGVNIGIGIVVPAYKILETILQPDIVALMTKDDEHHKNKNIPALD